LHRSRRAPPPGVLPPPHPSPPPPPPATGSSPDLKRSSVSPRIALAATALALVPASLAHAATKSVDMGTPIANQKALQQYGADVNAFFPSQITVHRGDKVKFVPTGFHSLEFPKKGKAPL